MITDDQSILDTVLGYKIPFVENPNQGPDFQPKSNVSIDDSNYIKGEISRLLNIKAIRKCKPSNDQFVSSIFLVPKSNGEKRLILNLKKLNKFVYVNHFKMEDIRTAIKLITPDSYMVNLDLKEAYFLVPIHDSHTKYLKFSFDGVLYEFLALPFGLCSAPYLFTKLMKPVATHLRSRGFKSVNYLDDSLCFGDSYEECLTNINETIKCLSNLGFIINYTKSSLVPNKTCQFLGFILNSQNMTLELPGKKKENILKRTSEMLKTKTITIRKFAQFLGTLTAACPAVAYGWLYTKSLERAKYLALLKGNDYDRVMHIPNNLKDDLLWWKNIIMTTHNTIKSNTYVLEIFSDASLVGWGAACGHEKVGGSWNPEESLHHINYLELLAVYFGLRSFANGCHNCEILLRIDNTTAIAYVNRMGGVQYPHLNSIARKIWMWCERRHIFVFASYIRSAQNTDADDESRNVDTEWEISNKAFQKIVTKFGTPELDLFASRINAKCKRYIAWKRDPFAFNIDAFTIKWDALFFYAFPPFALVLKVLRKIINDRATGIVVVPYWPSQPWFPLFTSLMVGDMIVFAPDKYLLSSNFREIHPLHRQLSLAASVLSGKHYPGNRFRNQQ